MAAKQSTFWKEHLPTLRKLAEAGLTDRQIEATGLIPGKSHSSIMNARTRYGIAGGTHARDHHIAAFSEINRVVSANPERIILGSDDTEEEPFDELLERAIKQTKRAVRKAKMRRYAVARIVTDRPIGVAWASDQHLTMHGPVDVERAFADARRVRTTEALYIVLGGDGVDNHVKHRAAMVNKASDPSSEYRLYDGYLRTLDDKILAVISGNHDDWTRDNAGVDMVGMIASRNRLHFAPDEVVLRVELVPSEGAEPTMSYTIKVRHQYRFNSSLNVGHTVKRLYDMGGEPFDVGVVCHHHEAHMETFDRHGLTRYAFRPGSYQLESAYSRRIGFNQNYPTCPGVVLYPHERRIVPCPDLDDLTERLEDARRRWRQAA